MPIYEYICNNCSHAFEKLVSLSNKDAIVCPKCESPDTAKQFSTFAYSSGGKFHASTGSSECSSCNASTCSSCR